MNRHLANADLAITLSLVEPHLLAGFSGGAKAVCPGVCGVETMKSIHSAEVVGNPLSREGVEKDNPLQEAAIEIAERAGIDFSINVTMDRYRRLTGIFAGETETSRQEAIMQVKKQSLHHLNNRFPAVVTTGSGNPLDATLYQSIKGAHGALQALQDNGTILLIAKCDEGAGSTEFVELLELLRGSDPEAFNDILASPGFFKKDQWMAQHVAHIMSKAELILFSEALTEGEKALLPFETVGSVEEGFERIALKHGRDAEILAVPEGSYVLPVSSDS